MKSHLARFLMVTGRHEEAIRVGREALAIAHDHGQKARGAICPSLKAVVVNPITSKVRDLDVVFDPALGRLNVARDSDELRRLAVKGGTVRVIPLAERLGEVADAFRRWSDAVGDTSRRVANDASARKDA